MWIIELIVVLVFIFLGARLGSIGIGFAGGFGVLVLALVFGLEPGSIAYSAVTHPRPESRIHRGTSSSNAA